MFCELQDSWRCLVQSEYQHQQDYYQYCTATATSINKALAIVSTHHVFIFPVIALLRCCCTSIRMAVMLVIVTIIQRMMIDAEKLQDSRRNAVARNSERLAVTG